MFIDLLALLEFIEFVIELEGIYQRLLDVLDGDDPPPVTELTYEERKTILRNCTKTVVRLNLDLACFPMGYDTTLLFDTEGNPVP